MNDFIDFAFLDSGTGGLPYMLELKKKCPDSRCVYLGDTAHFPYGEKSSDEITQCAEKTVSLIIKKWNPGAIVIACNTISVTSLSDLRSLFPDTPIVGTVPAIRLASRCTKNRRIGLLATNATVNHPYNQKLIKDFASDCRVFSRGEPRLIEFIEHRLFTASEEQRRAAVKPSVDFFMQNGCDTIILGCTHFTHVARDIALCAGPSVNVVDSRDGVANQALKVRRPKPSLPSFNEELPADQSFFVTALKSASDATEYETLCRNAGIPWGGLLPLGL